VTTRLAVEPPWERTYRQAVAGRESEIVDAFLSLRSDAAVARELNLRPSQVRRLVNVAVPEANVLRRARRTVGQAYADQELIDALHDAALDVPSPMTIESYRLWARQTVGEQRRPGPELIRLRFGGWRRALARAGLQSNSHRGPQAVYSYDDVVSAVATAWRELGRYPSVVRYEVWRDGCPGLPAAATARRFVRSWDDLLAAAHPLVYEIDTDARVAEG